ncbi:MAG: LLM class F420-dependent oxidoreductase [Deltaproteobacteria bacterium]|nr:LLM class F420-dependent oxidoreductase [Deltaproteobacteria bacterium]MBW2415970.1 LLM class F420-dependent oxidoreductase [Deltaproteobacteria bacterium]
MKIALIPINIGHASVEPMIEIAQKAEEVGFESLWTFEHVVVPLDYESAYPYNPSGKMGTAPETNFVDPLIALTAVAASTTKIRLGTGVNILPQTNPLYLAKQVASIDFISNGRMMLGVGIGWLREEFAALGVPFERRGARFDDYVVAMRKVWSGEVVEHESDFVSWSGFKSYPLPVQKPLPVIIGGSKGKVFQRIARHGDGWYAPSNSITGLAAMLPDLERACAEEGRDVASVEISAMWIPPMEDVDTVKRYEDLGVSRLIVPAPALGGTDLAAIERFADETLSKL